MTKHNWKKIKAEYVTGDLSLEALSKKHGASVSIVNQHCREEGWVKLRKAHRQKVVEKTAEKIGAKQADHFSKELYLLEKLTGVLEKALEDAEQFNRHIVQTTEYDNETRTTTTTIGEKVLQKIDTRAVKDVSDTLKQIESMRRSMEGILTEAQKQSLEQGWKKLELDQKKSEQSEVDKEVVVKIEGYNKEWTE